MNRFGARKTIWVRQATSHEPQRHVVGVAHQTARETAQPTAQPTANPHHHDNPQATCTRTLVQATIQAIHKPLQRDTLALQLRVACCLSVISSVIPLSREQRLHTGCSAKAKGTRLETWWCQNGRGSPSQPPILVCCETD
jgi:hypothetical protein